MRNPIISCRTASYKGFADRAPAHLASLGIRYVEVIAPPPEDVDRLRDSLAEHGLKAATVHGQCDVSHAHCAEQVQAQLPVLDALGSQYLFVSCKAGDTPLDDVYGRLRAAGDVAATANVTIVMETHPDLVTNGDVALKTMQAVDHPNVRVNYDTANVYFYNEGADAVTELKKILAYVAAVHLKETNGAYRTWHFPALGRGIVDFPAIFRVLDNAGFTGPMTLEIEGIEGEPEDERTICDRIAESAGYLRALGRLQ